MNGTSNGKATSFGNLIAADSGISEGAAASFGTLANISPLAIALAGATSFAMLSGTVNYTTEVQFPVDIAWGARGGPEFKTDLGIARLGNEQRNVGWEEARKKFTVSQTVLDAERKAVLIAFAKARRGARFAFRFRDFFDYQAVREPFVTAKNPIGWVSPAGPWQLVKTYSDTARSYTYRIFKPCSGLVVDANGVTPPVPIIYNGSSPLVAGTDYTIDFTTGLVTMLTGITPTNWSGWFDVPMRFSEDSAKFLLRAFDQSDWPDIQFVQQRMDNSITA